MNSYKIEWFSHTATRGVRVKWRLTLIYQAPNRHLECKKKLVVSVWLCFSSDDIVIFKHVNKIKVVFCSVTGCVCEKNKQTNKPANRHWNWYKFIVTNSDFKLIDHNTRFRVERDFISGVRLQEHKNRGKIKVVANRDRECATQNSRLGIFISWPNFRKGDALQTPTHRAWQVPHARAKWYRPAWQWQQWTVVSLLLGVISMA